MRRGDGTEFLSKPLNLASFEDQIKLIVSISLKIIFQKTKARKILFVLLHGGGACFCRAGIGFWLTQLEGEKKLIPIRTDKINLITVSIYCHHSFQ